MKAIEYPRLENSYRCSRCKVGFKLKEKDLRGDIRVMYSPKISNERTVYICKDCTFCRKEGGIIIFRYEEVDNDKSTRIS